MLHYALIANLTKDEMNEYAAEMNQVWVRNAEIAYAREEERALAQKNLLETARSLKAMGLANEKIAEATKLSLKVIQGL